MEFYKCTTSSITVFFCYGVSYKEKREEHNKFPLWQNVRKTHFRLHLFKFSIYVYFTFYDSRGIFFYKFDAFAEAIPFFNADEE